MAHRTSPHTTRHMTQRARRLRREATVPERMLWGLLRNRRLLGLKFRRQVPIGPYVVDYLCEQEKLVVELDGMSHMGRQAEDDRRSAYLSDQGLRVARVTNDQVLADLEAVAVDILRAMGMQEALVGRGWRSRSASCAEKQRSRPSPLTPLPPYVFSLIFGGASVR